MQNQTPIPVPDPYSSFANSITYNGQYHRRRKQEVAGTYQIDPATSAELALARSAVLESEGLVEGNQVVMSDDGNALCNLRFPDPLDIRPHQSATDLLSLVFGQHCERMDGDRRTILIVPNRLAVLYSKPLGSPGLRQQHAAICHTR